MKTTKSSVKNILTDTSFQVYCIKSEPSLTGTAETAHSVDTVLTATRAALTLINIYK